MSPRKSGLGRGLEALFTDNLNSDSEATLEINLMEIEPNINQPRKEFDTEALQDLSESIKQHGVLQPILVRPLSSGTYQIVAGERRWRASRLAGLTTIPVVIKELSDRQVHEIALIENLQREDLNPVEEAEGYKLLIDEYGLTQEETAQRVNKSRPAVTNALRLLALPNDILWLVRDGQITAGHGKALLQFTNEDERSKAVELAKKGASVRDIERLARKNSADESDLKAKKVPKTTADFHREAIIVIEERLNRKANIVQGKNKGTLEIEFYGREDLCDLLDQIFELSDAKEVKRQWAEFATGIYSTPQKQ